jgi:large subunit ribosomal protein L19
MNMIEKLSREEVARVTEGKRIPLFQPGDTLRVSVKIKEGERERVQAYEGVCIARSGGGLNESFTVRKISFGEGVERVFPLYSPLLANIEVVRRGQARRAKLYYLRDRRGKSARIAERAANRAEIEEAVEVKEAAQQAKDAATAAAAAAASAAAAAAAAAAAEAAAAEAAAAAAATEAPTES